jgi:hypothetical protein
MRRKARLFLAHSLVSRSAQVAKVADLTCVTNEPPVSCPWRFAALRNAACACENFKAVLHPPDQRGSRPRVG